MVSVGKCPRGFKWRIFYLFFLFGQQMRSLITERNPAIIYILLTLIYSYYTFFCKTGGFVIIHFSHRLFEINTIIFQSYVHNSLCVPFWSRAKDFAVHPKGYSVNFTNQKLNAVICAFSIIQEPAGIWCTPKKQNKKQTSLTISDGSIGTHCQLAGYFKV